MWSIARRLALRGHVLAIVTSASTIAALAQSPVQSIDEVLENISTVIRRGKVGYATVWDGNKFVQCRRTADRQMRCEAAGTTMQPSLARILTVERRGRLEALGWTLDPTFGNYARTFSAETPTRRMAADILQALVDSYDVNVDEIELSTRWVADVPCPPRAGYSQNLAGSVGDAPGVLAYAVTTCQFTPDVSPDKASTDQSLDQLRASYGARIKAELQRLRLNRDRPVWVVFDVGIGYVQCAPETPKLTLYCEAQSEESWAALSAVITPERRSILRSAGYADPGRAPNYSKSYPMSSQDEVATADQILTILHSVYGYVGRIPLETRTER